MDWSTFRAITAWVVRGLASAAWWIPRVRRLGALTGLILVMAFAIAMINGLVSPETCACFAEGKVSEARHKFVMGLLAILGALGLLLEEREGSKL